MSKCARIMQLELWTVLFAEIQKGSNTRADCCCCCCCVYASNLFLIISILLGICDSNTDDSIANTEINLTTDVEYLGSYDDDLTIDFSGLMILFVTNSRRLDLKITNHIYM
jgi:hypothetical protein